MPFCFSDGAAITAEKHCYGTPDPHKPGCKTFLRPGVRCHLVHQCYIHKLQQDCHCGEVRCDIDLQTLGCRTFPHLLMKCYIVRLMQMASPQANGMNIMIGAKHRIVCRKFKRQPMERVGGTSCSSLATIQDLASTRQVMQV